jgi:hypothetical protein
MQVHDTVCRHAEIPDLSVGLTVWGTVIRLMRGGEVPCNQIIQVVAGNPFSLS